MDFSLALQYIKEGCKVSRAEWNGSDMYVFLQKGYPKGVSANQNMIEATGLPPLSIVRISSYLMMKTADDFFVPWLGSQSDLLAEDWFEVL